MVLRCPALLALALLTAACASPEVRPKSPGARKVLTPPSLRIEPSRLIPDLDAEPPHGVEPDGTKRFLALQMRLTEHPDGSIRKAPGLMPAGRSDLTALSLPSRLGGGYLFVSATTSSTQLWRAEDWLSPLESLVRLSGRYDDVIPGFDRLYLASRRANTSTVAIDPASGQFQPLGPLPMPTGQGPMVFADAWRAVSVPDFRGPLATFDAGASWVPLGISEAVESLSVENDAILIRTQVQGRTYALDADGSLAPYVPPSAKAKPHEELPKPSRARPLRLAIERGCPISPSRVLVADGGDLIEVSTEDGAVVRTVRDAYPESFSECQGMALGSGVGFVCGARQGATVVYAYEAPRTLRAVLSYPEPKAVFSSGNGALVVRAPCPGGEPIADQSQYCVRDLRGNHREIRFQGDLGAERVVALADGRVAILIAPRPGAEARLVVLDGSQAVTRSLALDKLSQRQRALVRRGLWMQGAIEVKPGVLGVWVEGGGPVIGLHVGLDGKVEAGPTQTTPGIILVSGRVGLVWRYGGEGLETTDGGLTWREFSLPVARPGRTSATRGCSSVGCAVEGWLRVGWGKPADAGELEEATEAALAYPPYNRPLSMRLTCAPTGRASPPIPPAPPAPREPGYRRPPSVPVPVGIYGVADFRGWAPFGPLPPPALGPDQAGVAGGRDYGDLRFKAFAWGPKNADWSRAGRWMVAFDDPYDAVGLPVSTSPAVSPWSDPTVASMLLNAVRSAVADPGGRSAVIGWCPGHNQCQVYSITDGEAPLELLFGGTPMLPIIISAVRSHEGWYLLSGQGTSWATVYAVDATGRVRVLGNYPRARAHQYDRLQLVRRALGPGIALWGVAPGADGGPRGYALPIDTATGELLAVQDGGPTDLGGQVPPRCAPGQDGWLLDMQPPVAPRVVLPEGAGFGGSFRMRVRVDGERACLEALSGRAREDEIRFGRHQAWLAGNAARTLPMAVWDAQTNRKYEMACSADAGPTVDR